MKKGFVARRNGSWLAAIPDNDLKGGYKRFSGFATKAEAQKKLDSYKYEIRSVNSHGSGDGNLLFRNFFDDWLKHVENNSSYETHKTYKGVIKDFTIFLGKKYPQIQWLYELTPKIFDDYKLWLRNTGYQDQAVRTYHKSTTINNHLKVFKAMFNQAINWEYIEKNPIRRVALVSVNDEKVKVTLATPERFNLFFSRCKEIKPEYYPMFYCSAMLGLRFGEMATLKWETIDLDKGTIRIVRDETFNPKGRSKKDRKPKERILPITKDVAEVLAGLPRKNKYVFLYNEKPIDRHQKSLRRWIIAIVRGTELEGMTQFHELRHTAGDILGQSHSIYDIKKFLGHSDIRTTERYVRVADKQLKDMADTLGKFGNTTQATTQVDK